ncbi:hypothetical protein BKA56DRAFT_624153 [Ilyonectria sp. MPI-CAGE-AT-0026]|nr:hypothetical protein BKA56DRAFT_624153 [Ilyonectria sp. MPI-CAGE-AT-0026]
MFAGLGLFLDVCHVHVKPAIPRDLVKESVKTALDLTKISLSNKAPARSKSDEYITKADCHALLSRVLEKLRVEKGRIHELFKTLSEEHGALPRQTSLDDVMKKPARSVDTATARLWEQLTALHMTSFAADMQTALELFDEFIALIGGFSPVLKGRGRG